MKNIIFIPYIKREKDLTGESSIGHSNRHQGYEWGINSWKAWAKKNNHEVYVMSNNLLALSVELSATAENVVPLSSATRAATTST